MNRILFFIIVFLSCEQTFAQQKIRDISIDASRKKASESRFPLSNGEEDTSAYNEERAYSKEKQKTDANIKKRHDKNYKSPVVTSNLFVSRISSTYANDAVLYRDVVRHYTWLVGVGEPITQEIANKLPYYFRLSNKNEKGHYQLVEAMANNALTTMHPLSTYIIDKDNENEQNKEWCERLNTIGKWVLYPDISGENIIEERAYEAKEKDANLVYSMTALRNDSAHATISYLDAWGYPADMNENENNTYGSLIYVTYDSNGYDAIIDYLDGEGLRKTNIDGVDQKRYVYDEQGRVIQATSNNLIGDYVIDNWGNCGYKNSYNGDFVIRTNLNNKLEPMRMPDIIADKESTYISCIYSFDEYGRKKEATIVDANGYIDCTLSGIHRIVYSYSSNGNEIERKYYDKSGNPITF